MLMRVTWGKIKPGKWDEYERLWKDYVAKGQGAKGLKARYLVRDAEKPDAGYSISIWDSEADFEAFQKTRPSAPAMEACFAGQYVTTVCDVRGATPLL